MNALRLSLPGIFLAATTLSSLAPPLCLQAQAPTAYKYIRVGKAADSHVTPRPGFALMGGGSDLDEAFRWLCDRSSGGDFLVLRATLDDDYNNYLQGLCRLNSVATLVIPSREAAMDPFVARAIRHASAIFLSGGDQANYINFWKGTPVQAALNDAIRQNVPMGGTSAGLAVLGQWAYSAQGDKPDEPNLSGETALADPFDPHVTLVQGFLKIPVLTGFITDSHFAKRDRMGRLLTFLARLNKADGKAAAAQPPKIRGIGVEEGVAVLLELDGYCKVVGNGNAYFLRPSARAQVLAAGKPLTFRGVMVRKVAAGHTFNIAFWRGNASRYALNVEAGAIHSTQAGGAVY